MAGAGYKLFNTGDVLTAAQVNTYLQEQAVMRFANAAARTTALSGVLAEGMMSYLDDTNAVEVYNGSAWVSISADQTPLTTKGDLFTFSTTDARLGVGANGDTLVADSSTTTGLRWQGQFMAGKNAIINGDFRINQRAFTSITASNTYGFDRWKVLFSGGTVTYTPQTFTAGTAPVIGYEGINFARVQTQSQSAAGDYAIFSQPIEDVRTFANQTVTISFWAKANSGSPKIAVGCNQGFGAGGSATVTTYAAQVTLNQAWQRFSVTFTVPTVSGKTINAGSFLEPLFWVSAGSTHNANTGSLGIQNNTFDFWGVQVESGSVATPFTTATGTLAGELAACQRYYIRYIPASTGSAGAIFGPIPTMTTTTIADTIFSLPVEMRANPSALDANELGIYRSANAVRYDTGTFTLSGTTRKIVNVRYTHGTAIFTAGETGLFVTTGTAANPFVGFSAEL